MAAEFKGPPRIFSTQINSFHYLYGDAEYLHGLARRPEVANTFANTQLSRTALLLYILSLEALANRALDTFLPARVRDFVMEREAKFSLPDKWLMLPLLVPTEGDPTSFQVDRYPWSHFAELVKLRNDFVHPKHNRRGYLRQLTPSTMEPLKAADVPSDAGIDTRELAYPQTRVPRDPYAVRLEHVEVVKKVVDDIVAELDRLLGGRLTHENWLRTDQLKLIYPPGATFQDVP